jgi:hypothetical protein
MKTAIAAITFAMLIAIPAYAGEYRATLECHNSSAKFDLAICDRQADCLAYASAYVEDESAEGHFLCSRHSFEVNVSEH